MLSNIEGGGVGGLRDVSLSVCAHVLRKSEKVGFHYVDASLLKQSIFARFITTPEKQVFARVIESQKEN